MSEERRQKSRRTFSYYMRVLDDASGKLIGHLSDIGTGGFKLDSKYAVPLDVDLHLRIDQTGEISKKSFVAFSARARWCPTDRSQCRRLRHLCEDVQYLWQAGRWSG